MEIPVKKGKTMPSPSCCQSSPLCQTDSILAGLNNWVKQTQSDAGNAEFHLELSGDLVNLSEDVLQALVADYTTLNTAIQRGLVTVSPGIGEAIPVQEAAALELLAPGIDAPTFLGAGTDNSLEKYNGHKYKFQLIPLGIVIRLTPAATAQLIAALGAIGAIVAFLGILGIGAPLAAVLAPAIKVAAAAIILCQKLSKRGAVGLKFIANVPFPGMWTCIPFPN
jgi:hypothetical protein